MTEPRVVISSTTVAAMAFRRCALWPLARLQTGPPPLVPQRSSDVGNILAVSDIADAKQVLALMLGFDFEGVEAYRRQLLVAELERHETGCRINVDRARAAPAEFDARHPSARLGVEAAGHGKLVIWLHGFEGYLDDLELLNH